MSKAKPTVLTDQASRDRIVSQLGLNMLVEAGAGSGKTHEMARRMAAGIASGAYVVQHMAAVTFTRKAAAELRGRFQLALEHELKQTKDPVRAERIRMALSSLEHFFAGTIHSFCAHLLRERPVEAGVSPGFTELDELQDSLLRRQSWRDFRTQAKAAGDPFILELLDADVKPSDLDGAFDVVCLFEDVDFPSGDATPPDPGPAWDALDTFWSALKNKLPKPIDPETTCKTQQAARNFFRQMRIADTQPRRAGNLVPLLETWDFTKAITQMWWADDTAGKKKFKLEIAALHDPFRAGVVQPFLQQWRQYIYRIGITLLTRAREQAAADRRRQNTLNYGDLLHLTARVLRTNASVRRALQQKCRWLFVDEFQDTDPVQAEIMFLLAGDEGSGGGAETADWRKVPLRAGSLFVVGDPKQSIYRFRRADIDTYNEVRQRIATRGVGEVLPLTTNFRSVPALCEWANDVFRQQFPAAPTMYSPQFADLDANRQAGDKTTGLFTLTVPASVDKDEVEAEEAARIARFIRSEVDAGRRAFGDFLILTRKKKNLPKYSSALENLHIPLEVSGAGAFGESVEVHQIALLLRALADPQDGVSLVGILRGPMFGLSDQELFAYRQAGGWFSLFSEIESSDADASKVIDAIASLRQMFRWTRIMPTAAALERILENTGYLALAATSPDGVEAGDLLHAVDRVRSVVEDGFSLMDAAAALEDDAEEATDVESLPLEPGRGDVVRLMNLHKAKGLEAPVVFLADPRGGVGSWADVRIVRGDTGATGFFQVKKEWGHKPKVLGEPAGWDAHEAEELRYLEAEGKRLLYVAATRARDALVIGRWANGGGGRGAWDAFSGSLTAARELKIPASVSSPLPQKVDLSSNSASAASSARIAAQEEVRQPSWSAASVTSESHHVVKMAAKADADGDDPTRAVSADTPSRRADAGMAWGTLVHGLLEHAMRHKSATREDLHRLALWLTVEEPHLRAVISEAVDTVQLLGDAPFWAEAKASKEAHEEAPFAVRQNGGTGPQVLNGVIDLVYHAPSGWRLIDYKTDTDSSSADLRARYAQQIGTYQQAWKKLSGVEALIDLITAR